MFQLTITTTLNVNLERIKLQLCTKICNFEATTLKKRKVSEQFTAIGRGSFISQELGYGGVSLKITECAMPC